MSSTRRKVGVVDVFYREAGPADAPVILLLHGFPTTSHMFRNLIPQLAGRYRVIAPDLPGHGLTIAPPRGKFSYTFDNIAKIIAGFTQALVLTRYALYLFDYGAPTGFRLAAAHPERVSAIMSQNGNTYEEGLSDAWNPYQAYWRHPTDETRATCRAALTPDATRTQYLTGADASFVSPDGYALKLFRTTWDAGHSARPDLRLSHERGAVSGLAAVPTHSSASPACHVGQK